MLNTTPFETLVALALDLLAQSEARHRAARRLERAADLLAQAARTRGTCDEAQLRQLRDHLRVVRDFNGTEQMLFEEFDRALDAAGNVV